MNMYTVRMDITRKYKRVFSDDDFSIGDRVTVSTKNHVGFYGTHGVVVDIKRDHEPEEYNGNIIALI